MDMNDSYGTTPANKENTGRSGKRKLSLSHIEGEKDEDYRIRRLRNNEAVRKSRDKSKKKTEETLKRVDILKLENCKLEEKISNYQKQLADLKGIFLAHAGPGKVSLDIDIDALLNDTDLETEAQITSSSTILGT